jgi:hypothetical protein
MNLAAVRQTKKKKAERKSVGKGVSQAIGLFGLLIILGSVLLGIGIVGDIKFLVLIGAIISLGGFIEIPFAYSWGKRGYLAKEHSSQTCKARRKVWSARKIDKSETLIKSLSGKSRINNKDGRSRMTEWAEEPYEIEGFYRCPACDDVSKTTPGEARHAGKSTCD